MSDSSKKGSKSQNPFMHLIAGGCAGLVESSVCHPLDTIKVRKLVVARLLFLAKGVVAFHSQLLDSSIWF
jgi:hypothetical protein